MLSYLYHKTAMVTSALDLLGCYDVIWCVENIMRPWCVDRNVAPSGVCTIMSCNLVHGENVVPSGMLTRR